jgi:hypothetical protein
MTENQLCRSKTLPAADLAKLLIASLGPALRLLLQPSTIRQWRRLLDEGIDPLVHLLLQANNTAIIDRWLNHGAKVSFVCSFPRSGNTWMRFMLTDILLQRHDIETKTELPVDPDDLIPVFCSNSIVRRINRCPRWAFETDLAFVKTHALFERLERIFSGSGLPDSGVRSSRPAPLRECRILYLYRAPEDALVSLYHLKLNVRDPHWRSRERHKIDDFCRAEVSGWVNNISSYLRAADNGFPVFFVSYEWLLEKPVAVLTDLLHWMGVQHDSQIVQRAVSNMRFCNLQAKERQENKTPYPVDENALFFRHGRSGSGRSQLMESTVREIHERTASLLNEANHRQMNQLLLHPVPVKEVPIPSNPEAPLRNGEARESKLSPCL